MCNFSTGQSFPVERTAAAGITINSWRLTGATEDTLTWVKADRRVRWQRCAEDVEEPAAEEPVVEEEAAVGEPPAEESAHEAPFAEEPENVVDLISDEEADAVEPVTYMEAASEQQVLLQEVMQEEAVVEEAAPEDWENPTVLEDTAAGADVEAWEAGATGGVEHVVHVADGDASWAEACEEQDFWVEDVIGGSEEVAAAVAEEEEVADAAWADVALTMEGHTGDVAATEEVAGEDFEEAVPGVKAELEAEAELGDAAALADAYEEVLAEDLGGAEAAETAKVEAKAEEVCDDEAFFVVDVAGQVLPPA